MRTKISLFMGFLLFFAGAVHADLLKPYVLGNAVPGGMTEAVGIVKTRLVSNGFQVIGSYSPYPTATVIVATNDELKKAALKAENGGFGAAQRIAVTEVGGKLQVSYANPDYISTAYGLGNLPATTGALKAALGREKEFGAQGMEREMLKPRVYRYAWGMPYFHQVDFLHEYPDHQAAVATIEKNLAAGKGGTQKVYRLDLPGEITVFGVGINKGDGPEGLKDTDKEVMEIIDHAPLRSTAYLPYEIMVQKGKVIALRGRYRIAVHFPDTKMFGDHSFMQIQSAPDGIKNALTAVSLP